MQYHISDASFCFVPQDAPIPHLSAYAQLLLETGIDCLEMPFPVWERLKPVVPAQKAVLVLRSPQEREQALREGVDAFLAEGSVFAAAFHGVYPDVTVVLPADGQGRVQGVLPDAGCCAGIRAAGFADGMAGDYAAAFAKLRRVAGSLDAEDSRHLATAAALEWLLAGGGAASASFGGAGGRAALEQLLAALRVICKQPYRLERMPHLRTLFEEITGRKISAHAPVMGSEIFTYESGIHADGIEKNPKTYEPFPPEDVGRTRRLSIGKHSGKAALRVKLQELGVRLDDAELERMNTLVRAESTRLRRGFTDAELLNLEKSLHGRR